MTRHQCGYTLIETAIVLSVFCAILVVLVVIFTQHRQSTNVAKIETGLRMTIETVRANWRSQADYSTATTANVTPLLPPAYAGFANPYGGSLTVSPASWGAETNTAFDVTLTLVPKAECATLIVQMATQVDEVRVTPAGGSQAVVKTGLNTNITPDQAVTACSGNTNSIVWRSL